MAPLKFLQFYIEQRMFDPRDKKQIKYFISQTVRDFRCTHKTNNPNKERIVLEVYKSFKWFDDSKNPAAKNWLLAISEIWDKSISLKVDDLKECFVYKLATNYKVRPALKDSTWKLAKELL